MALEPGLRIGPLRVGTARPAPPGAIAFAVEGDETSELVAPNAHLRLRAGARDAWLAARARRSAAGSAALPELGWVEVDGWPVWHRPRVRELDLERLSDDDRASLAGWLAAAGVDLSAATPRDLVVGADDTVRYAPLGLDDHQLAPGRVPLDRALGPAGAPREVRQAPRAAVAAPGRTDDLRIPTAPAAFLVVQLPRGDAPALARVAARTATVLREVERAAERPGRWVWAPVPDAALLPRLRGQAERAGLVVELADPAAPSPTFWPAVVFGGLAQVPVFVSTGVPELDFAIIGGLGVTALASTVRALARIGPARRGASGTGAWEAWTRGTRTTGVERALLALELRLAHELASGPVRVDLGEALDAAWTRLFAAREAGAAEREERLLADAARDVAAGLAHPDTPAFTAALRKLRG